MNIVMYKIVVISAILIFTFTNSLFSQEDFSYESVDKKTSELFQARKWEALIQYGNKALKRNVDFYSLRRRLGTAYYEKKQFVFAAENIEKAVEMGFDDQDLMEKLYYSYLQIGRTEDAEYIFTQLSETRMDKIRPLYNSFINNLIIESGEGFSNDMDKNGFASMSIKDNSYSEQTLNGNVFMFSAGMKQLPLDRVSIVYGYTYLNLQKEKQFQTGNSVVSSSYPEYQNKFYNKLDILIDKGLIISPAGQYINKRYTTIYLNNESSDTKTDNTGSNHISSGSSYSFTEKESNLENFVISMEVKKYISLFKFSLNGSFSYLNEIHQSQTGISFAFFPSGKTNLITETYAVLHFQDNVTNLIGTQVVSVKLYKNLSLKAYATFGNINNFNEYNGRIVYSNSDVIKLIFGTEFKYELPDNFTFYLNYFNQQTERNYTTYELSGSEYIPSAVNVSDYNRNSFSAGLKYTF